MSKIDKFISKSDYTNSSLLKGVVMLGKILCLFFLHSWGAPYEVSVRHLGEYPWDTWQHICTRVKRNCRRKDCYKTTRSGDCLYPIEPLPDQK